MAGVRGITKDTKIDEVDVKILKILLADARENQKDIAEKCGITPVAVLRRIKKLKMNGVIIGTCVLINKEILDNPYEVTVLIDVCNTLENDVKAKIRQIENVIICAESIGRYNLCTLIITHDLNELKETICKIRNIQGVKNVNVNIWTGNRNRNFERDLKVAES
jgi:Lrp/AsnC family transcriptional regulator, leucine-responsive regulatory protein